MERKIFMLRDIIEKTMKTHGIHNVKTDDVVNHILAFMNGNDCMIVDMGELEKEIVKSPLFLVKEKPVYTLKERVLKEIDFNI